MLKRSLANLLKVRRTVANEAKRVLADAVATEEAAAAAEAAAATMIQEELASASAPDADDAAVDALRAWLPHARRRLDSARESRLTAEAATARARAALTAARSAEAAVENLMEMKAAVEQRETERQAQAELNSHMLTRHTSTVVPMG